jgi:hypothetical protein
MAVAAVLQTSMVQAREGEMFPKTRTNIRFNEHLALMTFCDHGSASRAHLLHEVAVDVRPVGRLSGYRICRRGTV